MLLISFIKLDAVDQDLDIQDDSNADFGVLLDDGFVCDLSSACKLELNSIVRGFVAKENKLMIC
jgi:hypothetical protein